jgi:hypothetical protein
MLDEARFIEQIAAKSGVTPRQLVRTTLSYLPWLGVREDEDERVLQIRIIAYGVVRFANEQAPPPPAASIVDLIDEQDLSAHLTMRGHEITVKIDAAPRTLN